MNNALFSEIFECLKNLNSESPNQAQRYPDEIVVFDKLIEIYRKEFKTDNKMFPEDYIVFNSNNIESIIWVILLEMHQNFQFNTCLMLESLLVSD